MPHAENCRCPICHHQRSGQAPSTQMTVRLPAHVKARILSHPLGARAYLEHLVKEEPTLQGKLQTEKILRLQERQAHNQLKSNHKILKARYEKAVLALRRLAELDAGQPSRIAAQALVALDK